MWHDDSKANTKPWSSTKANSVASWLPVVQHRPVSNDIGVDEFPFPIPFVVIIINNFFLCVVARIYCACVKFEDFGESGLKLVKFPGKWKNNSWYAEGE